MAALQCATAWSTTRSWFRVPAWPHSVLMTTDAVHRNFYPARWMRLLLYFVLFHWHIPRTRRLEILVDNQHLDGVVAFGLTRMLTAGNIVGQETWLYACGTLAHVTLVLVRMMTFRCKFAEI